MVLDLLCYVRAYYTFFEDKVPERFISMAKAMGEDVDSLPENKRTHAFITALTKLIKSCNVEALKMSDFGIQEDEIPKIAENARTTMGVLFILDRYPLSLDETIEIIKNAYK